MTSVKTQPRSGVKHFDLETSAAPGGRGQGQARWENEGLTELSYCTAVKGEADSRDLAQGFNSFEDVKEPLLCYCCSEIWGEEHEKEAHYLPSIDRVTKAKWLTS